ncbi:MAG TPA: DUF2892 domain-containing protein [Gemmatimonadales bacterium]|nr:DUF2892 domain-containing protein [Gemmatimonadales bacterium]
MVTNIVKAERFLRIVVGVLLLGLYGALPAPWRYLTLIGLVPLGTGLTGHCPIYAAIGWNRHAVSRKGGNP